MGVVELGAKGVVENERKKRDREASCVDHCDKKQEQQWWKPYNFTWRLGNAPERFEIAWALL